MGRPYIICHMMASVDGRIDCGMTGKLEGVKEYYETLYALNASASLSGRITGMLELAEQGEFKPADATPAGKEMFSKKKDSDGYEIIVDTRGTLLWKNDTEYEDPHLIITSELVSKEYLAYLDEKKISWIACGKEAIDLVRAMEILRTEFGIERLAVVGGAHINGGFLKAGLIDEVSVLIGPGIDGRGGMPGVFDGLAMDQEPIPLKFKDIKVYDDGAVWIRYTL